MDYSAKTLINGDKLIDLLLERELAVKKKALIYYTADSDYFNEPEEQVAKAQPITTMPN